MTAEQRISQSAEVDREARKRAVDSFFKKIKDAVESTTTMLNSESSIANQRIGEFSLRYISDPTGLDQFEITDRKKKVQTTFTILNDLGISKTVSAGEKVISSRILKTDELEKLADGIAQISEGKGTEESLIATIEGLTRPEAKEQRKSMLERVRKENENQVW